MTNKVVPLGDIATLQAGFGFPPSLQGRASGQYPFAKVGDISRCGRSASSILSKADHYVDASDVLTIRAKVVPPGSILFAKIGEAIRQNHRVVAGCEMLIDNNAMAAIPKASVDSHFLFHYLKTVDFYCLAPATTVPALRKSDLEKLEVPLPPLPEQRRIAAILDQADALRAKRREALAQLDSLTQSIFIEMFGDPVSNDRKWHKVCVSDFVAGFETGKSLVAANEDDQSSEFRVLKISAVTSLEFKPEQSKALPLDYEPPKSHFVRLGDLLFSRANTADLIGATALVDATSPNLVLPDKLWRFVWYKAPRAAPRFVQHLFRQTKFRYEIAQRASGTSGSMKNISQEKVFSIRVGLPPLPLQQTFATRIQSVEALKATHRASLAELDALFASLQHRAFAGAL